jgi:ribose transport system substrate-binding protein
LKRLAWFAFGAVLLAGCGKSGEPVSVGQGTSASAQTKRYKIGVSIPAADHGWTAGVKYWAEQAKALHPECDINIATADTPAKQISDIESMMSSGVDGLVVLATESAPLTPTAKAVHDRGIFLVNVDRGFLEPVADIFLEGDNVSFGRKSAEYMADRLKGNGKIAVLEGIPCTVNTDRVNGFKEVMARYPGIKIVASQSGMWNRDKSLKVMQSILAANPDITAVWASDDDMALGAEQAIKEAGKQDQIWMLGGAGMKDVVKRVMDGDKMFPADITYPPSMIAAGIQLAVSSLQTGQVDKVKQYMPKHMKIDVELITPDNAKNFYFPDSVF